MVHYSQVVAGIAGYLDEEMVSKVAGTPKAWIMGAVIGLASTRAEPLVRQLSSNPMVVAMGLVDGENIDVDAIYGELIKQAKRGSMTMQIPMMGAVTFNVSDVEKLYRHIKEGR